MDESLDRRRSVPLRCSCGCTFAQLSPDGEVIIISRHHGKKCVNVLTLEKLLKLRQEAVSKK